MHFIGLACGVYMPQMGCANLLFKEKHTKHKQCKRPLKVFSQRGKSIQQESEWHLFILP